MENNYGKENFEGFAYLDYDNLTVSWNIARGVFSTPTTLPEFHERHIYITTMMAGMLSEIGFRRLHAELAIERIRVKYFPNCVSRLSGIFVFDEIESIVRFWEVNNWGRHFKDEYLSDVGVAANRSTRVDSNWIGQIIDADCNLKRFWRSSAYQYWAGVPYPYANPIWERIVDGYISVWDKTIRLKAFQNIEAVWPDSIYLLCVSALCAHNNSHDGQIFPFLSNDINGKLKIAYSMRMNDLSNHDFVEKIFAKHTQAQYPVFEVPVPSFEGIIKVPNLTGH